MRHALVYSKAVPGHRGRLFQSWVIMMYAERNVAGQAVADSTAEIERAVANVKRSAEDNWFRRMWYRAERKRSALPSPIRIGVWGHGGERR